MRPHAFLLPLCLVLLCGAPGQRLQAADAAETRARLEALQERIAAVRDRLREERRARDRTSARLAEIEQDIGATAGRIEQLDQRIESARAQLESLAERRERLRTALADHRDTLAAQLRAAHRLGRQPALRLLLRQDHPDTLARTLGYYAYFNRARLDAIEHARTLIADLREVDRQTRETEARLTETRERLAREREGLEAARAERRQVLARLEASIAERGDELDRLEASRARLEELLREIGSVLGDLPAAPLEERPFATRANQLPWPASGELRARYGGSHAGGRMKWRGIVIAAPVGSAVRAVYYGRVVFADWLEGFGQLLIVDHLDGYLSLYGYNRRLLRSTGDWVEPGEAIARVGASGGRDSSGLYFEIRHGGQPVDPMEWLAAR